MYLIYKAIFTFQYGSTLIIYPKDAPHDTKTIYIPIWFYFNEIVGSIGFYGACNLHSNMVLL